MMFLVAEVHPFADGNGRIARVMMNAELLSGGQTRIFIPSVLPQRVRQRPEAADQLPAIPPAFLRVMSYAQEFVSRIDFK